jgi:hypothetical protein
VTDELICPLWDIKRHLWRERDWWVCGSKEEVPLKMKGRVELPLRNKPHRLQSEKTATDDVPNKLVALGEVV